MCPDKTVSLVELLTPPLPQRDVPSTTWTSEVIVRNTVIPSFTRVAALAALATLGSAAAASAQVTVTLPDTNQTTVLTAAVTEQARITVPSGVTFTVSDVAQNTDAPGAAVTIENIVLATASKQLQVSLKAEAANFTPPVSGATTWAASDVSWAAGSWTNATAAANSLNDSSYNAVATCSADASACSTSDLVFTLAAKSSVKRSGNHVLTVRWRVESIGS